MLSQRDLDKIKKEVRDFFQKMTYEPEVRVSSQKDQTVSVDIQVEDPQVLIGEGGQTLAEVQHLLKIILRKKIEEHFYIDLDVNDYKKKKGQYLKESARSAADEVSLNKREKQLDPMTAYERRIVHMELAERQDIVTESMGEEPERRILIKPRP